MEDFGETKFEQILLENSDKTVDEISNEVIKEITQFSRHNTQHDDITLVILKWKQKINLFTKNKEESNKLLFVQKDEK
jgi:serine phosphatase RsbU (regulator of sigma subunit)